MSGAPAARPSLFGVDRRFVTVGYRSRGGLLRPGRNGRPRSRTDVVVQRSKSGLPAGRCPVGSRGSLPVPCGAIMG
jgi:hypothetical protein